MPVLFSSRPGHHLPCAWRRVTVASAPRTQDEKLAWLCRRKCRTDFFLLRGFCHTPLRYGAGSWQMQSSSNILDIDTAAFQSDTNSCIMVKDYQLEPCLPCIAENLTAQRVPVMNDSHGLQLHFSDNTACRPLQAVRYYTRLSHVGA